MISLRWLPQNGMLSKIKWWFLHRVHPHHKYHLLKTGLKPGYHDPDVQIVCAVFQTVKDFVKLSEKDWSYSPERTEILQQLKAAIYHYDKNKKVISSGWYVEETKEHLCNIMRNVGYLWYP